MNTWNDGTPRSQGSAFDWRGHPSEIFAKHPGEFKYGTHSKNGVKARATTDLKLSPMQLAMADLKKQRHGGAYSKSKASK